MIDFKLQPFRLSRLLSPYCTRTTIDFKLQQMGGWWGAAFYCTRATIDFKLQQQVQEADNARYCTRATIDFKLQLNYYTILPPVMVEHRAVIYGFSCLQRGIIPVLFTV